MSDWVAPDTAPGRADPSLASSRRDDSAGPRGFHGARSGRDPAVPRPVPLRPMTASDILDGAFAVLKAQPTKIAVIAATFIVPVQLVQAWAQRDVLGGVGFVELLQTDDPSVIAAADDAESGASIALSYATMAAGSLVLVLIAAAIAMLVAGWYAGVDRSAGEVLKATTRRSWALFASWLVIHILELIGFVLLVVPGVLVMAAFVVTAPVVTAERVGAWQAMRRSWRLTRRRFWPSLGVALLTGIVANAVGNALSAVPTLIAAAVGLDNGWILLAAAGIVSTLVTTPMVAAATVLLYLDLRIRTEGLDLQLETDARFAAA